MAWRTGINWPLPPDPSGLPAPRISAWPWHGTMARCHGKLCAQWSTKRTTPVFYPSFVTPIVSRERNTTNNFLCLQAGAASRDYLLYTNCYWMILVVLLPKKRRSGRLPRSRHNNGCGTGGFHGLDLFRAIAHFCFAFAICFSMKGRIALFLTTYQLFMPALRRGVHYTENGKIGSMLRLLGAYGRPATATMVNQFAVPC